MFKLMKYVKPYGWMLLFSIALLFAQANLDLALPDYLSRIVNTGIQQGGVEVRSTTGHSSGRDEPISCLSKRRG
jgi:ABC-type multidrug transport system fused ATPase/permease subunit